MEYFKILGISEEAYANLTEEEAEKLHKSKLKELKNAKKEADKQKEKKSFFEKHKQVIENANKSIEQLCQLFDFEKKATKILYWKNIKGRKREMTEGILAGYIHPDIFYVWTENGATEKVSNKDIIR